MEGLLLSFNWLYDNGMNFMPHVFLGLLIGLGFAARANSTPWLLGLAAALGISWGAMAVASFNYGKIGHTPLTADATIIKTLTFNLYDQNTNYEKVVDYIWNADADVVCLQEAEAEWRTAVSALLRLYPHALQSAKGGTILLSKHPVSVLDVKLASATPFSIGVTLEGLERPVDVLCLHLTQPDSPSAHAQRNMEMGYLARTVIKSENPFLLMGDFNASTRSPALFRFMQQAGLKTASPGFPPANSWPAGLSLLGIRIDHVMYSEPLVQIRNEVGPALGSNHRPVRADLALPNESRPLPEVAGELR